MESGVDAQTFTRRQDRFFGKGKYSPESNEGKRLSVHKLTHVLQQGEGIRSKLVVCWLGDHDEYAAYCCAQISRYRLMPADLLAFTAHGERIDDSLLFV